MRGASGSRFLLDTNVISELRRPRPEPHVVAFVAEQPLDTLFVSDVTLAELRFGIAILADPARRSALSDWLDAAVRPMFEGRCLPFSEDVLVRWRWLLETGRKQGHTFSQPDLMIAATALHHDLTVVTRDRSEFDRAGARVMDPWTIQEAAGP